MGRDAWIPSGVADQFLFLDLVGFYKGGSSNSVSVLCGFLYLVLFMPLGYMRFFQTYFFCNHGGGCTT